MTPFRGFPKGSLRFVSVPDLFFTQLVPQIDDLAELKVTLHILWLHARYTREAISLHELAADETLLHSLAPFGETVQKTLDEALEKAVRRGSLIQAEYEDDTGRHTLYFLNSERGRQAQQKLTTGHLHINLNPLTEQPSPDERPNIFRLYEDNIGLVSPILADELHEAEATYPPEWIAEAFKIAAEHNARHWKYVRAVLERMATSGRLGQSRPQESWYTNEELSQFIQR